MQQQWFELRVGGLLQALVFWLVVMGLCLFALTGCGAAQAERVNGLTRQQLAQETDGSICHPYAKSAAIQAERAARNLGDCSEVTIHCKAMGYPVGSTGYLQCRQTLAQEKAARAAVAASIPPTCTRYGNTVQCY